MHGKWYISLEETQPRATISSLVRRCFWLAGQQIINFSWGWLSPRCDPLLGPSRTSGERMHRHSQDNFLLFWVSPKDRRAPFSTNTFIPQCLFIKALSILVIHFHTGITPYDLICCHTPFPLQALFYCKDFLAFYKKSCKKTDFKNKNLSFFFSILS